MVGSYMCFPVPRYGALDGFKDVSASSGVIPTMWKVDLEVLISWYSHPYNSWTKFICE